MECTEDKGRCHRHGSRWPCTTREVLVDISHERVRQFEKYGTNAENSYGTGPEEPWLFPFSDHPAHAVESGFRRHYENTEENGQPVSWVQLVREELAEAFMEDDPERLAEELIQVAALCTSWVEKIRERKEWGVIGDDGRVVIDSDWHCPADVMRGTHGFNIKGPVKVVYRNDSKSEWKELRS